MTSIRFTFAGGPGDFTITAPSTTGNTVTSYPNAHGTAWSQAVGGTQYTDLLPFGSDPSPVETDLNGFIYPFQGPVGITLVWVDFGGGQRFPLLARELVNILGPDGGIGGGSITAGTVGDAFLPSTSNAATVAGKAALAWIEFPLQGAGIDYTGATDSTAAIQAVLDSRPGLTIRALEGVLSFTNLNMSYGQHLKGSGWSDYRDLPGVYGSTGWATPSTFYGTVLRSTATTGNAITVLGTSVLEGALSDFILIGPGSGTSVGVSMGSATMSVVHPVVRNVKVGNFSTGVITMNVNEGSFYDLTIHGCSTPLNLYTQTNQNAFYGLDLQKNSSPALVDSTCTVNTFYSPIGQSNVGTVFAVSGKKTVFVNPYFENNGAYGIDVVAGTGTTVIAPHLNAAGDSIRIQAAASGFTLLGFIPWGGSITNAGVGSYLQGTFSTYLTDTGTGTTVIDPGRAWQSYTPTIGGTGWALGNGTISGAWTRIGRTIHYRVQITWGSTSTFGTASPTISLPYAASGAPGEAPVMGLRQGVGTYRMVGLMSGSAMTVYALGTAGLLGVVTSTAPATWASTDTWNVHGTYESAA
ncbi:MAG TPA: hypothetical protein VMV41_07840 [Cellulomonadaceae bacterium]|nr:hypothetical protein [Cellulomonadaceae bacterium]